ALDDVRIYSRAISQQEIQSIMASRPEFASKPSPENGAKPDIEHFTSLSWLPGEKAARHDVYFGTDAGVVGIADTFDKTGVYRGRQDPNYYTPPETLTTGQTYYWRIDEFNTDATFVRGKVWSFTISAYLIVDDFESYNDIDNRIFDTWGDYYVNNTGMTVGHLDPTFAERIIVNSGSQSMYMRYDNDGTVNEGTAYEQSGKLLYSEAERQWTDTQDWTRRGVNSLTLWFRGIPASVGSFTAVGATYKMTAAGADIWGTSDQFHFAYKMLSAGGTVTAKVVGITNTDPWAKAGLMIRETLDADSKNVMVVVTPGNGVAFQYRSQKGGNTEQAAPIPGVTAPQWVRLMRSSNTFTARYSANGTTWKTLGSIEMPMLADVYVGLCLTSRNVNATCTADFSNVTLPTTGVTGQWQSQDIGIQSNVPEQLYIALEDSTGNSAVVKHPELAATTFSTYTEWNIPLTRFTGVNLQAVKKLTIGVGDRASTQPGSAGDLYIDDIRLIMP
ncbi:MAG: DUF1349 domain-containing protein, partial [Sedimentisphaerales bacterium]|nr:DUF1349 domain-containing protein [Sedimentisphaerales bacterium]